MIVFHSVTNEGYFDGIALGFEIGTKRIYYLWFKDSGVELAKGLFFSEAQPISSKKAANKKGGK